MIERISRIGQFFLDLPMGVGRGAILFLGTFKAFFQLVFGVYGKGVPKWTFSVTLTQIYFTGVQALPIMLTIAAFLSTALMSFGYINLRNVGAEMHFGQMIRFGVLNELGPLLTALIITARSGTAVTAELAALTIHGEIDALRAHGVSRSIYIILPRMLGVWLSLLVLSTFFVLSIYGGCIVLAPLLGHNMSEIFTLLTAPLMPIDIVLLATKSSVFGVVIPLVAIHHGLKVKRDMRDLPRVSSQAAVVSIMTLFVLDAVVSLVVLL